jgi:hypothetical protein
MKNFIEDFTEKVRKEIPDLDLTSRIEAFKKGDPYVLIRLLAEGKIITEKPEEILAALNNDPEKTKKVKESIEHNVRCDELICELLQNRNQIM